MDARKKKNIFTIVSFNSQHRFRVAGYPRQKTKWVCVDKQKTHKCRMGIERFNNELFEYCNTVNITNYAHYWSFTPNLKPYSSNFAHNPSRDRLIKRIHRATLDVTIFAQL